MSRWYFGACTMQAPVPHGLQHRWSTQGISGRAAVVVLDEDDVGHLGRLRPARTSYGPSQGLAPILDLSRPLPTSCSLSVTQKTVRPDRAQDSSDKSVSVTLDRCPRARTYDSREVSFLPHTA